MNRSTNHVWPNWRLLGYLALFLSLLATVTFLAAGALLASPAALPQRADLVVVLGGDYDGARYARGRQLVLDGFSTRLWQSNPKAAERIDALTKLPGVTVHFDSAPGNTWQEAQAVQVWMQAHGYKSALVVSDPPHLLRVGYAFASNLWGNGLKFTLIASQPTWWSAWSWWQNQQSLQFVKAEVAKLGYYLVRYRFGL
jgi:uncharacterized SAM-binding protein YcdF (DUF218 family)